ncbi:AAA family ATPase [uncultured Propionivibrio sp.]|uniref:AAA family ATPase n=1 Tax=uncultured Propionivibrio sp. TaxID=426737 RepID=UPI0029BFDC10|nr:AAA family ATPase [uncultured Propionivibrio sp.]
MLNSISIQKFKGISAIDLSLGRVNVIIGGNNAGKSSILQAIQFAVSIAQTTSTQNTRWSGDRMPSSLSSNDLIYAPIQDVYALGHNGSLQEDPGEAIQISFSADQNQAKVIARKGRNKNIVVAIEGKVLGDELRSLEQPFCMIVPGLSGIPAQEFYRTPSVVTKLAARGDSNSVFRNILLQLSRRAADWHRFIELLQEICPGVEIEIVFDENTDESVSVSVTEAGRTLPIDASGTGVLQAIQILSYILLFKPKLLILDEPDSHLHPNNQRKLIEILLRAQAENSSQIIISTHSKYIVDELLGDATVFWVNKGSLVQKIDTDEEAYVVRSLMEIGALSEGENLGVGEARATVITEDKDGAYINLLLEANGWCLDDIEIWPYQGCSNISVANALIKYIRQKRPQQPIVLHRDRDFLENAELDEYISKVCDGQTKMFIPDGNDLEAYFLKLQHFLTVYPEFDEAYYHQLIDEAISRREQELKIKLVNTRIDSIRKAGNRPNEGQVAIEYADKFASDKIRYSHGKILLRAVNELLRERTGVNSKLVTVSDKLGIDVFLNLKAELWP